MKARFTAVLPALVMASALVAAEATTVSIISIDGAISPTTAEYIQRAMRVAGSLKSECLIIRLDTPGGLLDSTKTIVQAFYSSPVPTVVFVAPAGANAGSAGCFITMAADVAVMAPNTSIGAAHPVEFGGFGQEKADDVMTKKLENFAVSYIEAIAVKRNRNIEWAKSAVRDSASITAEKALELKVVDLLARDPADLLRQIDGRVIGDRTLRTADAQLVPIPMLPRERVFQLLWRPEVIFLLMLVAIYGIIGELSNPGVILPGVAGGIALLLVLYMGAVLPVNIAGVALLVLGVALFIADAFAPTHGVLTGGGIIAFALGALLMFEGAGPAFQLPLTLVVPATLVTAAFFMFVIGAGLRAQSLPVKAGRETMTGQTVPAITAIDAEDGWVLVEGESWSARSLTPIPAGARVVIVGLEGLTLQVKPKTEENHEQR